MPRIVFWNVNNKDLTHLVCAIANDTEADVIVLIENKQMTIASTLKALQKHVSKDFYYPYASSDSNKKFHCFSRNNLFDLSEVHSELRLSVRQFRFGYNSTLLALVHGVDIRNYDPETRQSLAQGIADQVRFAQKDKNIEKVILLGDFNMNPFDKGMNLARGFNAMMTKACVKSGQRENVGEMFDFYYNPMWNFFGDNISKPPGTIYDTSNQGHYGWSMLDQVIIHHSIIELFQSVEIMTSAGTESLMDKNRRPDVKKASDHFPIFVVFKEDYDECVLAE